MIKVNFFPLTEKIKRKFIFFSVNTKNISSHVLKISAISLVLRTREITDVFNTFDTMQLLRLNYRARLFKTNGIVS